MLDIYQSSILTESMTLKMLKYAFSYFPNIVDHLSANEPSGVYAA